jgi:hypothetical protein
MKIALNISIYIKIMMGAKLAASSNKNEIIVVWLLEFKIVAIIFNTLRSLYNSEASLTCMPWPVLHRRV